MKDKLKKAAALLLFKRHKYPGAKEWELRKYLGEHYEEILKVLEEDLEPLGLQIKCIEEGDTKHYAVVVKDEKLTREIKTYGWRIDEMAVLAVSLSYILSRGGKAAEKDLIDIISNKIARWRVERAIEKFIRLGYLEREDDSLKIGLRSKIEFNLERLVRLFIGAERVIGTSREDFSSRPQE